MINLKIVGAAALLAIAPALASSADARPGGHGGGGAGMSRGGGGGGMNAGAFRGGNVAAMPGGRNFASAQVSGGQRWAGGNWNHGGSWNRGRYWRGPGFGFVGGLAAGAIGSSYYYNDPYYYGDSYAYADDYADQDQYVSVEGNGDDTGYCAQRFKSYDPASGTYLGYDGQRHPCP